MGKSPREDQITYFAPRAVVRPAGDVLAAACAWAASVATIGLIVAPDLLFAVPCAVVLLLAAMGVYLGSPEGSTLAALRRCFGRGAVWVLAAGVLFVPLRLREQTVTRHPAVYRHNGGHQCDVRPDGSEGGVSLWRVDCGSAAGPIYGWDERVMVLLEGESLYERVPRARPAAR